MAKGDLQSAQQNWVRRITQARQAGLPDSSWQTLMQRDLGNVSQGHTPMAEKEVTDAIRSSAGLSPIKDPSSGHSFFDIIGNIPGDIRDIVTGFPAGVAGYVTSLPKQMADLKDLIQQDPQTIKELGMEQGGFDIGGLLRNMSKVPVLSPLLPGVHTAAEATTSEGRKQLEEHPVGTVLDVAAAVSAAGKLGAFGQPAALAEGETAPLTVREALAQGQPYKAFGRGALKAAESTPHVRDKLNRQSLHQFAMNMGFHPDLTAMAKARGEEQTLSIQKWQDWAKEHLAPYKNLNEEEKAALTRVALEIPSEADKALVDARPDMQQLLSDARRLQEEAARLNPHLTQVKTAWQRTYTYSRNSPVAKAYTKHQGLAAKVKDYEKQYKNWADEVRTRTAKFGPDDKLTQTARIKMNEAQSKMAKAQGKAEKALEDFNGKLTANMPAAFYPMMAEKARQMGISAVEHNKNMTQAQITEAIAHIQRSVDWKDFESAVGKEMSDQIRQEVEMTWSAFAQAGANPIFLPNVGGTKLSKVAYPSVIPDAKYTKAASSKQTAFNLSRSNQDIVVGLGETERQLLTEAGTNHWVKNAVAPFRKTSNEMHDEIVSAIRNGGNLSPEQIRDVIKEQTKRNWVQFDPGKYGIASAFPTSEGGEYWIPKGVDRSLKYLGFSDKATPLANTFDRGMNVWRFAVLMTPRHIAHVLFGGAMMGELQDPLFLTKMRSALHIMKQNDPYINAKFGRSASDFEPDTLVAMHTAGHVGRILTAVTKSSDWIKRFEDNATQMYKISYMLRREKHMLKEGMSTSAARDEAFRQANKVFVDQNAMSPLERGVFRKVFPFWGFTRHLFRYLMTYPVDHPYRAAILTNLAEQHYKDWNSGLPQQLQWMMFLGSPDAAGNVSAIDYRSIDPFRSFYNDFTLAGLTQQANPAIQFVLQQAGVNVLSATPELYPGKHYDPSTGTFVADRPGNPVLNALEAAIPETQGLDALLGMSDQYRNLKATDPDAYKQRVYSTLGIPYYGNVNVPRKEETAQLKRYQDADAAISKAMQSGDFTAAKKYDAVPVPAMLKRWFPNVIYATPGDLEKVYRWLQGQAASAGKGGTSLHALLPRG